MAPTDFQKFSKADSLKIAKALSQNDKKLNKQMTKNLGANIPVETKVTEVSSLASSVPLECFNNANADEVAEKTSKMDIDNMSPFRMTYLINKAIHTDNISPSMRTYLTNKIVSSKSASNINSLLNGNVDKSILDLFPISAFQSSKIDVSQIESSKLSKSYKLKYSRDVLENSTIDQVDDNQLSKIIPGIKKKDLEGISDSKKSIHLMRILKVAEKEEIELTSSQRSVMRNSLIASLESLTNSKNASVYLSHLTSSQIDTLYPLFIESSKEILANFSSLSTFGNLVSKAAEIPKKKCCNYARGHRTVFANFALKALIKNSKLTLSDLLKLGDCFATVLQIEKFSEISETDFMNYYPSVGRTFQPDKNVTAKLILNIKALAASKSDKVTFVFEDLNDLSLYYPNFSTLNQSYLARYGEAMISEIKAERDPENKDVQLCRLGLENNADVISLLEKLQTAYVSAYQANDKLTCEKLNNMVGSLNSISVTLLDTLTDDELKMCKILLGDETNKFSSEQLAVLSKKVKSLYQNDISSIPDSDIISFNAIFLGFSNEELSKLNLTSISSLSTLGSLSGWSFEQLENGLSKAVDSFVDRNGGILTLSHISALNNLACCLKPAIIDKLTSPEIEYTALMLSKISSMCPNIESWYNAAKNCTAYGSNLYQSAAKISELGSIMAGISVNDLALIDQDLISAFGSNVWDIMSVSTVNSLNSTQLVGLTLSQVRDIMNSPNYEKFSKEIKEYCNNAINPQRFSVYTYNDPMHMFGSGSMNMFSLMNLILSLICSSFILVP